MSTNQLRSHEGAAVFRSEWLKALVRAEHFKLPPPLPSLPGAIPISEAAPSSIDRGEGAQLARYYYQRIEKSAGALSNKREGQVIGVNINHYIRFTRSRLCRLFDALDPKQRTFFALVPYLLNANAPGIPGYQPNSHVPHGLYDCDFNATVMRAVEQIFGHRQRHSSRQGSAINTLFCETNLGSMSKRTKPHFRFWLLIKNGLLERDGNAQLRSKVHDIQEWLKGKGLDAQFYLIDYESYQEGADPTIPAGLSKSILREKFYRDMLFIGGQLPLWWAAPAGIKAESYSKLISGVKKTAEKVAQKSGWVIDQSPTSKTLQTFVDDKGDYLTFSDLGFLEEPTKSELVDYTFEYLTSSLFDPFNGVIKMGLNFARLDGVPFSYVCDRLKKAVSSGDYELEYTDINLIALDVLNHQFKSGADRYSQRLFRLSIYLGFGVAASRTRNVDREVEIMKSYAAQWGWSQELLEELDTFSQWRVEKIDYVSRTLRTFLLDMYRRISRQAQTEKIEINSTQDIVRRRRLSACFEGMVGKVPHLFTYFVASTKREEHLLFIENPQAAPEVRWELHRGGERTISTPLFVGDTLALVSAWAVFNGLFNPHTVVSLSSQQGEYNIIETRALLHKLHGLLADLSPPTLKDQVFIDPPKVKRLLISVSPTSFREESSNSYAAHGWDILNYGQQRRSQLTDISVIMQNTWGELFSRRYQGPEAFTQAMKTLYADSGSRLDLDQPPEILGPNDRVQPIVRKRIQEILEQTIQVFADTSEISKVFTYEVGGQFQVIYNGPTGSGMNTVRSLRGVIRRCGRLSAHPQELLVDQLSPSLREVRALVTRFQGDVDAKVYVGWRQTERLGYVVVCDERQRLFFQQSSASETRLAVMRVVRRALPYLRQRVGSARELKSALRIFEFNEGQIMGGRGPVFTEATSQVLGALSKSYTGTNGLWLIGRFDEGRAGIGLRYGQEQFLASRYGSSFVYACVKHIVEVEGLSDPELWTLDGSKVDFGPLYRDHGVGAVQHLRLVAIYQKEITKALNYILQHHFAEAQ